MKKECGDFSVKAESACSTHWDMKCLLLKIISIEYIHILFFIWLQGSVTFSNFRKLFPKDAVCQEIC